MKVASVPDRRMWAQQATSTQWCEIRRCVNVCINVDCECNKYKECKEKEKCIACNSMLTYFGIMCIYVIYKVYTDECDWSSQYNNFLPIQVTSLKF
jgi:hypothetical protein